MSEADVVARTTQPVTHESLIADLDAIGLSSCGVVLVHTSVSALGWVCGGEVAIVSALVESIGASGTLVMPTHTSHLSEPALWGAPAVPEAWWPMIRDTMPAFDPGRTPTRGVGAVVEYFRSLPGTLRSDHPHVSFAARGPAAREIVSGHALEDGLGPSSPLGALRELDASVLLLGVGHDRNTSLHLAQVLAFGDDVPRQATGAPMLVDGERAWVEFEEQDLDTDSLADLGARFERVSRTLKTARVGAGTMRLMKQRELVEVAVRALKSDGTIGEASPCR